MSTQAQEITQLKMFLRIMHSKLFLVSQQLLVFSAFEAALSQFLNNTLLS